MPKSAFRIPKSVFLGIDEAGYGPNLGPLVVVCVAFRGPQSLRDQDWWELFSSVVGRSNSRSRLVVDDSKRVLSGTGGFDRLARTVHVFLDLLGCRTIELEDLFDFVNIRGCTDLRLEHWFPLDDQSGQRSAVSGQRSAVSGQQSAVSSQQPPVSSLQPPASSQRSVDLDLRKVLGARSLEFFSVRAQIVFPAQFNARLGELATKADLELELVGELLEYHLSESEFSDSDLLVTVDRLGGRRYYRPLLEDLAGDVFPQTIEESPRSSIYRFGDDRREVEIRFQVKADSEYLPVALASMVAKYLRERCMAQFNAFWSSQVPGLEPTAGYPVDARRFLERIRPHLDRLGISGENLWRCK